MQHDEQVDASFTADVVVVGSGVAGLCAAVAAAERGLSVIVLERSTAAENGGNTRYTEAFLRMKSIDEVADDLVERLTGDFMGHPDPALAIETFSEPTDVTPPARTLNIVDGRVVDTLALEAGPTLRWLEGHGLSFDFLPTPFQTTSTTRMSPVGGGLAIVETMTARAVALGVEFLFETSARDLLTEDGRVVGIVANSPDGRVTVGGAVVLGCGGYQGNAEMMSRYHGDRGMLTRPVARGGHYNKGEGIEMAIAAGAATAGNFSLFHAEPIDPRSGVAEAAIFAFPFGILVNTAGERFVDEAPGPIDAWYERITRRIHAQADGVAYLILDADARDVPRLSVGLRTDQPPIVAGTIGDLADALAIPRDALGQTVDRYNAACPDPAGFDHGSPDGLATEAISPAKSNWSRPVSRAPFHAYPVIASNVFTFGGLRTDECARVLDRDGRVIDGLFAAGEMTGLYYSNYTGSTSVLRGAVFGRIAGQRALEGATK